MLSSEVTEFLRGVVGVVEATSYEYFCLWQEYHKTHKVPWKENNFGMGVNVGFYHEMPVFISLRTAVIDGWKILFYHDVSPVVNHDMIKKWLKDNLPEATRVDAMNFHKVFPENPIKKRA